MFEFVIGGDTDVEADDIDGDSELGHERDSSHEGNRNTHANPDGQR